MPDPVRIESDVWERWNFDALAEWIGCNKFEAIGRIAFMWAVASKQRKTVLPEAAIRVYLGVAGVEAMIAADLGERVQGGIRLKGSDRFEAWWEKQDRHRVASAAGGAARVTSRGAGGKFVGGDTNDQPATSRRPAEKPADDQPETSRRPAGDQPLTSPLISDLGSRISDPSSSKTRKTEKQTRARAMPAEWEPTAAHLALASEVGASIADEFAAFRDFHASKGSKFVDWDAAFRTWLRNSVRFGGARRQQPQPQPQLRGVGRANPMPANAYPVGDAKDF